MTSEINLNHQDDCIEHLLRMCDEAHRIIEYIESGESDIASFAADIRMLVNLFTPTILIFS